MSSELPTVSCIMPTANRRRFAAQAVRYFLAQDYPHKELVIVDDGADPVAVRYYRQEKKQPLGSKRNFACSQALGRIIAHWDDDDWSAPWRLRYQVEQLLAAKADICGLERVLFYAPADGRAWEYVYPGGQRRWVYGASLCYTKAFWETHQFAEIHVGEDTRFVWANTHARIHTLPDARFLVSVIHEHNTSPKRTSDPRYSPKAVAEIEQLLGPDAGFYGPSQAAPKPEPSALVTAALGIGDILRVTPLIRVLHRMGYAVDVLLTTDYPEVSQLLEGAPEIRRIFHMPSARCGPGPVLTKGLAEQEYELATFTAWSAALRQQVRCKRTLAFQRQSWLNQGDTQCVESMARDLGWQGELPPPFAMPSTRQFNLPAGTLAIHPGCKYEWPWKKWHGFDELAGRFASVVVIGAEEDTRTDNTYFRRAFAWPEHARNFIGKLSLPDTAALLRECDALVSNDSGLMHLAVALGVPTFGIFGITSPQREKMASKAFFPITKGLGCEAACHQGRWGRSDCEYHLQCLKTLTVQEVMQQILAKTPHIPIFSIQGGGSKTAPSARKQIELLTVAVEITGGIGDVALASSLLLQLHASVPECVIEVFYHTPEVARFVFHQARYVRAIHPAASFAEAARRCDLTLRIHTLVKSEIRDREKLRRVDPEMADRIQEAIQRFDSFRGFFERGPQFDSLWGRICVREGLDRRTSLGWLTGLPIGGDAPWFLSPDSNEYAFFERHFADSSAPYVTVHDGFDNNVRLAPGAATKCWPLRHWTALVSQLKAAKPGLKIVQLGGRNSRCIPGVDLDLVRRTTLAQAAWVLKHAQAHIDTDSGLVHLARALHTRSVTLFGPTDEKFFGYRQNINLTASNCANCWWSTPAWISRCPRDLAEPECMAAIQPERVRDAACQIINDKTAASCEVAAGALYGNPDFAKLNHVLQDIFAAARIPPVAIRQHGLSHESGMYLHASKQWEYLFAWSQLEGRLADGAEKTRVADLGGGRGAWTAFLASQGASVEVFDVDYLWDHGGDLEIETRFMRWAREHAFTPRLGSLFNLPIEDETYDVLTSISVVEHLRYKRYALREALRVLKPGGMLILTFDFSVHPEKHQDTLRKEIFSPESLDRTLAELGMGKAGLDPEMVAESARKIQQDGVLGIPDGMTVGGVAIVKH
jgi:ADP-heptose:LPS heptosyltransferase/ubiquinone/menaquinone biosynthesis C-methylase UbiE